MITSLLLISLISTLAATTVCRWAGLVDNPDDRKRHVGNIPLSGGIAVFITFVISVFALKIPPYTPSMLTIAILVFGLGVFDDFKHIAPWLRLSLQYGAGVALATYGGIAIYSVGNLLALGDIPLLILAVPLTALAVAGLSNAYNMIDGIDGLSASLMLIPLAVLSALALLSSHPMLNSL
ncbi:MAG: MraY family glycosyltransferase [Halioglobus sp.]